MACTNRYTNEQIVSALVETKGTVYLAAKRIGCNPDTIYARAKRSAEIADAIRHQRGEMIDVAELKLFQAIQNGESWAIAMLLKTQGKDRGYVERQEMSGPGGQPLPTPIIRLIVPAPDGHPDPTRNGHVDP